MIKTGRTQQSHFTPKLSVNSRASEEKEQFEAPADSVTLGDRVSQFAGDTVRTVGGTAAVALKSTGLVTSSVLKGFGMEEKKADRLGTVASLATFGTAVPLTIMGSGVVGTLAVKGLGLGENPVGETQDGKFAEMKSSYIEGVNAAYSDGQFLADSVMEGAKVVSDNVQGKASDLGREAAEGLGKAVDYGTDFTKGVVNDVTGVAKDAGALLSKLWN